MSNNQSQETITSRKKTYTFLMYFIFGLYPIYGVQEWGWTFNELIAFYWFESYIIIVDTLIRFWLIHRDFLKFNHENNTFFQLNRQTAFVQKLKRTLFFIFIFLFFSTLHGAAVYSIFVSTGRTIGSPLEGVSLLIDVIFYNKTIVTAIIVSLTMHFILIFTNYIIPKVWKSKDALTSIATPFARLFVLHISILVLGFILSFFNTNLFILLILFVVFKSLVEAGLSLVSSTDKEIKQE